MTEQAAKSKKETESSVFELLRERYTPDQWILAPQVPNGTGSKKARTADAVAWCLWPSHGLEINGFEIKVQRGDWLKEKRSPSKSHAIYQYCDRWWIVAPAGVVNAGEVPATWGYMAASDKGLRVVKQAPQLEPEPIDRHFALGMLRAVQAYLTATAGLQRQLRAAYERGHLEARQSAQQHAEADRLFRQSNAQRELHDLQEAVAEFEAASGVRIRPKWQAGKIGDAVRLLMQSQGIVDRSRRTIESLRAECDAVLGIIQQGESDGREQQDCVDASHIQSVDGVL